MNPQEFYRLRVQRAAHSLKHTLRKIMLKVRGHTNTVFTVLFTPAKEGGFVVTCPALPGLVTEGNTKKEAREMAKDAIKLYVKSLRADGLPIPEDVKPVQQVISIPG